ncbi:hypothetical protein GCM10010497_59680 [Streptomyces cinereoruber]|uniref:Uncharacterized protein n=1 Tax=Streptomyces cinereoruber TaxID=67260 RepID=A0AAV4KT96_9ACTN|nr:hypothetical protein [Streptomyces cinereoruber]NIH65369.1 hypothetical protein [Streptomyces cinereoruber]QEV30887.1 hypothetical protein CP977_00640 [Streptomyces cinereoruber]GGR48293.1 hypothetical protein GCM10010497_59680 [Streptomyces cinereoruber]
MIFECPDQVPEQEELHFCSRHGGTGQDTETDSAKSGDLVELWFIKAVAAVGPVIAFVGVHLSRCNCS